MVYVLTEKKSRFVNSDLAVVSFAGDILVTESDKAKAVRNRLGNLDSDRDRLIPARKSKIITTME